MNTIFHNMIDRTMEVYINDVIIKVDSHEEHLEILKQAFDQIRIYDL